MGFGTYFFKKLHFGQIGKWQFEIWKFLNFYSWQHWNPRAEVSFSFPSFFFFSLLKSVNVFLKQILKYPHFLTHERCTLVTVKKLMPSPRLPWSNLKSRAYILQCCQLWKQKSSGEANVFIWHFCTFAETITNRIPDSRECGEFFLLTDA